MIFTNKEDFTYIALASNIENNEIGSLYYQSKESPRGRQARTCETRTRKLSQNSWLLYRQWERIYQLERVIGGIKYQS